MNAACMQAHVAACMQAHVAFAFARVLVDKPASGLGCKLAGLWALCLPFWQLESSASINVPRIINEQCKNTNTTSKNELFPS